MNQSHLTRTVMQCGVLFGIATSLVFWSNNTFANENVITDNQVDSVVEQIQKQTTGPIIVIDRKTPEISESQMDKLKREQTRMTPGEHTGDIPYAETGRIKENPTTSMVILGVAVVFGVGAFWGLSKIFKYLEENKDKFK